jgi:hypothetical protein
METNEIQQAKPSAMSVGLKFGLILAIISIASMLIQFVIGTSPFSGGWLNSIISIALTVAVVVFAHKNFKENGDGFMSYGQGLGIAMITVIVSIVVGMIFSYVYLNMIDPSAFDAIWEKAAADMEAKGQSQEQIDMGLGWGKKLFWLFYLVGGAFWGLIIGLVVTIFTQKKAPEQTF